MADRIIVYWRDIPAQVIIKRGRASAKRELSLRFTEAIDMCAMRTGAMHDARHEAQEVDLDRGAVVVPAGVEEAGADAGRRDEGARRLQERRERRVERIGQRVEGGERRVAGAVLELGERPLAHARARRQRTQGQTGLQTRGPYPSPDRRRQLRLHGREPTRWGRRRLASGCGFGAVKPAPGGD